MATDLEHLIGSGRLAPEEIVARTRRIYRTILRESDHLDGPDFTAIHPTDVERLFDLYDGLFFEGGCRKLLGDTPMYFRLSRRMTKAAGKTGRQELRDRAGKVLRISYEIAISTTLLFQTFQGEHRPVVMSGIECRDRLAALQRVLEHEITHLIEMLIWVDSRCSAPRFQAIANRFFGHTDHRHQLITPREHAFTRYGIKPGDLVSFHLDGRRHVGRVNRISRRATVLVEDNKGQRYSDGKRYFRFYVPVGMLEPTRGGAGRERSPDDAEE